MKTVTKTTKKATKTASKASAKKAKPIDVPSANSTTKNEKKEAKRDGWGARMATGRHTVNAAVIEAGEEGAALKDITAMAAVIAKKVGCTPRGAVGTHLAALKDAGLVNNDGANGWRATPFGLAVWSGKETRPKIK